MAGRGRQDANETLAAHMAAGLPITEAAERAGVGERTARRRLGDDNFRALVARLKSEAVAQAVARLSADMGKAAAKLAALIDATDDRVALTAAKALLEMALKARAAEEIEKKLQDLTDRLYAFTAKEDARAK